MNLSLNLTLRSQLKLAPQVQQAIRFLQLSGLELEEEIQNILEKNILLEKVDSSESTYKEKLVGCTPLFDQIPKNPEATLREHLAAQFDILSLSKNEREMGMALIDAISEDGYLSVSITDLKNSLPTPLSLWQIEAILCRIQQLDPVGVGARNLAECLSLQLKTLPADTPWRSEASLVSQKALESLGKRDFQRVKKMMGLTDEALAGVIALLRSLDPRPGNRIGVSQPGYISPDLIVQKKQERFVVELNVQCAAKIRMNSTYMELRHSKTLRDFKSFKTHFEEAQWFLKSLQMRHETLLKVARYILEYQEDFFERGPSAMKPLSLQQVARALNHHESTISRITTQKYMLTPRGLFELKYFFCSAIHNKNGAHHASTAIRACINDLIKQETRMSPLSDQEITNHLLSQGIRIARRTVTKYRESMQIQNARQRKIFY